METKNTLLDDIAAEIGFTPAATLCAWYGGRFLYVPATLIEDHNCMRLIGRSAFTRLVRAFPQQNLLIPKHCAPLHIARWRMVYDGVRSGLSLAEVADQSGMTTRRVRDIAAEMAAVGMLTDKHVAALTA